MRGMEYLSLIVVIGVFVYLTVDGATQLNQKFPDNQIDTSNLTGDYNKIDEINSRVNSTCESFQKLSDEDTNWFQKIGAGIVAIPRAVLNFPILIAFAVSTLFGFITTGLGSFIPQTILLAIMVFLMIEITKQLLQFFHRARA